MRYLLLWLLSLPAVAGKDPDRSRKVADGHHVFTGARMAIGTTAEAFILKYPKDPAWLVSPSRYAVDFEGSAFQFRNQSDFSIAADLEGQWLRAVMEVKSVTETAVEVNGEWSWKLTYVCDLKILEKAGR